MKNIEKSSNNTKRYSGVWNLDEYFKNIDECLQELDKLKMEYKKISNFKGRLNNEKDIFEYLDFSRRLDERLQVVVVWSELKLREDLTCEVFNELYEKISVFLTEVNVLESFVVPELNLCNDEFLKKLSTNPKYPQYDLIFEDIIKNKPHSLSECEEKILGQISDFSGSFYEIFSKFNNADLKFDNAVDKDGNQHELTHANYSVLLASEDGKIRETAWKSMINSYSKFNNTLSANYIAQVKRNCAYAKIRNFSSAFEKSMFYEDVSKKVYDTLVYSVSKNLSVFEKLLDFKKKIVGKNDVKIWDLSFEKKCSVNTNLLFEEAILLLEKAFLPLGDDYVLTLKNAVKEGWFHTKIAPNKESGAFSWGCYGKHPVVFLSYQQNRDSLFTLAHEIGHAMHSYYSNKNQPFEKAGYEIFVAEVASNVNEMLLFFYLMENAKTDDDKISLLDQFFNNFRGSVMRQMMFAEFEEFAHKSYESEQPLSKELLNNKYLELAKKYFGNFEIPDEIKYEWSRIPHFYQSFYVYKYATGLISAIKIALDIKKGKIEKYLKFLKSGCTKKPVELLQDAGVDLTDAKTFEDVFEFIEDIIKKNI